MKPSSSCGLNLIELLVIIALIAILTVILIPAHSGPSAEMRRRAVDASKIRQLGQAALIYANDNRGQLPGLHLNQLGEIGDTNTTPNIHAIAAALAREGRLNDQSAWFSANDGHPDAGQPSDLLPIIEPGPPQTLSSGFAASVLSFQFIAGLDTRMPPATPIAFTRGLRPDGGWATDRRTSVYGSDGGHIVFLAGTSSSTGSCGTTMADT